MKIAVDADWDEDAHVWVAVAKGEIGLVTEAATIEALREKLALLVPDLLDHAGPFDIELVARSNMTIAA